MNEANEHALALSHNILPPVKDFFVYSWVMRTYKQWSRPLVNVTFSQPVASCALKPTHLTLARFQQKQQILNQNNESFLATANRKYLALARNICWCYLR